MLIQKTRRYIRLMYRPLEQLESNYDVLILHLSGVVFQNLCWVERRDRKVI